MRGVALGRVASRSASASAVSARPTSLLYARGMTLRPTIRRNLVIAALALAGCGDNGGTTTIDSAGASTSTGSSTTTGGSTTDPGTTNPDLTTTGVSTDGSGGGSTGPSPTTGGDTTDATTGSSGPAPFCGDGNVDAGEECDAGPANADDGACTLGCKAATCGDGLVQTGVEACDDGNKSNASLAKHPEITAPSLPGPFRRLAGIWRSPLRPDRARAGLGNGPKGAILATGWQRIRASQRCQRYQV